jgi:hypothetical protein
MRIVSCSVFHRIDSLYEEVLVCNTIRKSLDGLVAVFDLVKTLNRTVGLVDFFIQVTKEICIHVISRMVVQRSLCYVRRNV